MDALSADIIWPVYLARLEGTKTVVLWSTSYQSRIAINRFSSGLALPALATSSGLTYIAHLDRDEAKGVIDACLKVDPQSLEQAGIPENKLEDRLAQIRDEEVLYFSLPWIDRQWLTVPTNFKNRIFAALSIEFHDVDYSLDHIKKVYLPNLREAANRIAEGVSRLNQEAAFGA